MSYRSNRQKNRKPRPSEDVQVSPISKETAGAVAGAAIGSVAGPIGAVVGGSSGRSRRKARGRPAVSP
jgi:outer membrane lipoprotein SlyB